jgi:hypothetical protein
MANGTGPWIAAIATTTATATATATANHEQKDDAYATLHADVHELP